MKKLIILLILSFSGLHIQAQQNIIIPKGADTLYRVQVKWWYGIDPIQTKDGNYIIPVKVLNDLQTFEAKEKMPILQKGTVISITSELAKLPKKDIKDIKLKAEAIIEEPKTK